MSKDIKKWAELTEAREKANLSQKALADILGVDPVCVNRWEHGDSKPTFETTQRLAKILNVELSTLIGGRELHHAEDEPKEKAIKRFATKMIVQAIDTGLTAKPLAFHVTESKGVVAVKFPDGETYVSHCSKEDHFDIEVGASLAIARHLYGSRTAFLKSIEEDSIHHGEEIPASVEAVAAVDEKPVVHEAFEPKPDCGFTFSVKDGESFHFNPTGIDSIYICDCAVFKAPFDKDGGNDWEKSSGKKLLEQWFKEHAPAEIQEQFDIDLPTVEEVFSQKMINWWGGDFVKGLVSKQFPIFKDSDERMKEFEGKPTWWWTRSAYAGNANGVWSVDTDGGINDGSASSTNGFVPVLRRKSQESTNPDRKVEKVGSAKKKREKK